jgi:3-oxoadipate enol-lactonase
MGGMVGQILAARHPERFEAMVIAASNCKVPDEMKPMWLDRVAAVRAEGMTSQVEPALGRWITQERRQARPDLVDRCRRFIEATPVEGYAGWCTAIAELDTLKLLPSVRVPTLVVAGVEDVAAPVTSARTIAGAIPGAELVELANVAHMIAIEDAAAFTRAIEPFLMRHRAV